MSNILNADGGIIHLNEVPPSQLVSILLASPLENRRNAFLEKIGNSLQQLNSEGKIEYETLGSNEQFIDTVIPATCLFPLRVMEMR